MNKGLKFNLGSFNCERIFSSCFLFLLLFFCPLSFFAQDQHVIDSLQKILPALTVDTMRIEALNELAAQTVDIDPSKSINYAEEALKISEGIHHQRNIAASLHNIGNGHYNLA